MRILTRFLFAAVFLAGCDLQPRIVSLPDSVGDFISARYPALLADPESQPEIYNSAATDYGVYASPELYGSVGTDDYVLYASANDYVLAPSGDDVVTAQPTVPVSQASDTDETGDSDAMPVDTNVSTDTPSTDDYLVIPMYGTDTEPVQATPASQNPDQVVVARGDTLYAISRRVGVSVDELARLNQLSAPYALRVGQVLIIRAPQMAHPTPAVEPEKPKKTASVPATKPTASTNPTTTMVELETITVGPGDTLYSLSRKYSVPVNDLAVMNHLAAPFNLTVGQKLKVPNLKDVAVRTVADAQKPATATPVKPATTDKKVNPSTDKSKTDTPPATKPANTTPVQPARQKISSDPNKKLPTITARSSSKFTWPVRGTILSNFGAKNGGLFNDGINIAAARGTAVKAAENGVVAYAGNEVKGMGNLVIIQHSAGWMTVYAHMDSFNVRRGTKVTVGQKIGTVGQTGKVTKPQLHFEIRKGTKAYNPSTYLK